MCLATDTRNFGGARGWEVTIQAEFWGNIWAKTKIRGGECVGRI